MPESRVMVVTGASSGIGRALALTAARNGFAVLLVARRAHRLEEVARAIRAAGGSAETLVADVCSGDAAGRIVDAALHAFGRIDVLVNNAGGGAHGDLLAQSDAQIDAQLTQHVVAPLRLSRAALPHLERVQGSLAFLGSGVARIPLPAFGAYSLAKAAIRAAAIQLRRELRSRGVSVTYVDPGVVATEFHGSAEVERPQAVRAVPPERVAEAILRGIRRRSATVNAVAWQTAGTVAGEMLGTLVDPIVERMRMRRVTRAHDAAPHEREGASRERKGASHEREAASHEREAASHEREGAPHEREGAPREPDATSRESKGVPRTPAPQPGPAPLPAPAPASGPDEISAFGAALAPVARRMERVKLPAAFLRDALVPGATLEFNELAMRWAGMPNKNERAALREVLDTLAAAGYIEPASGETWRVVRGAA